MTQPFVQLHHVTKTYKTAAGEFTALDGISVDIASGEYVIVVGKSGAGKSTLVNAITGVGAITAGEIRVGDTAVQKLDQDHLAMWRGRNVGVIYQSFELLPQLSLLDNVLLPMDLCGLYRGRSSVARAKDLLGQVGLTEHMRKPPTRISGGQQQRVAIARALANDPPLIVADEPTGNLDSATAEEIWQLFDQLHAQGKTLIVVTHDEQLATRGDRLLHITDGQLA